MSLQERIETDLKQAMRDKNAVARETLRMVLAAMKNRRIDRDGVIRYVHKGFSRGDGSRIREEIRMLLKEQKLGKK